MKKITPYYHASLPFSTISWLPSRRVSWTTAHNWQQMKQRQQTPQQKLSSRSRMWIWTTSDVFSMINGTVSPYTIDLNETKWTFMIYTNAFQCISMQCRFTSSNLTITQLYFKALRFWGEGDGDIPMMFLSSGILHASPAWLDWGETRYMRRIET